MTDYTKRLAAFCSEMNPVDIPSDVLRHAIRALSDTIGCGLYGSKLPWSSTLVDAVSSFSVEGDTGVIGRSERFAPDVAALVNGAMIHSFEYDDLHMESFLHPGATVLPALLAATSYVGRPVSGTEFVEALIVGYEVGIRVGLCAGLGLLRGGWHNSAVIGPVGAASAVSRLLRLSPDLTNQCFGAAATQAGGLVSAQFGALVKRLHAGRAAQSGFYAGALVQRGYTGIEDVFDQTYGGFPATLTDEFDLDELVNDLGDRWRLLDTGFKVFPVSASCYTSVEAALWAYREHGIRADEVVTFRIHCSSATQEHVGWPYVPSTTTTAQMNLRYSAAAALLDGRVDPDRFTVERLRDPDVMSVADRFDVRGDGEIDAGGRERRHAIRAEIVLDDGRVLRVEIERAMGFGGAVVTEEQVREKFVRNATSVVGDATEHVYALAAGVQQLDDVRELLAAFAGLPATGSSVRLDC